MNGSGRSLRRRWMAVILAVGCTAAVMHGAATAQSVSSPQHMSQPIQSPHTTPAAAPPDVGHADRVIGHTYGLWALLPAAVAILLAVVTRQVVPALVVGVLTGAYMQLPHVEPGSAYLKPHAVVGGFRLAFEHYLLGAIHDLDHIKVIVFTLIIGFTVGVIGRNGGTSGLVRIVAGKSESPRRSGLTAWLAGMVVFFDDYANSMIVGPTMQPVFDRVKLSRAKLAYIVDSTAAPVASIALIGTWVGAEIGYIEEGIKAVAAGGAPSFLTTSSGGVLSGMQAFLRSIPHRFYPILALFLVFVIVVTRRDFGPMKRSEKRAQDRETRMSPQPGAAGDGEPERPVPRWWLGLIPIATLVIATISVLAVTGLHAPQTLTSMNAVATAGTPAWDARPWWDKSSIIISNADSYISIFYGAILSAFAAVLLSLFARACRLRDAVDAGLEGSSRMFPAVVILILAWSLSKVLQDLQLGWIVSEHLRHAQFPLRWLPLAVFASAALISFSTGTSWGTMGILCPATVEIASRLATTASIADAEALNLFYASIGSVLAGAIFGDHCSPISDTTVLSSVASGCPHEEHVWTQIPYALITALAAMGLGDVLCSAYGYPWYLGMGAGAVFLLSIVVIFGRTPHTDPPPPVVSEMDRALLRTAHVPRTRG